jgi:hypothetical protein
MDWFVKVDGGLGRCICSTGAVEKYVAKKNKEGDRVYVVTPYNFVFDNIDGIERVLNSAHSTLFEDYLIKGEYVEVEPYNYRGHYQEMSHLCKSWNYLLNGEAEFVAPKLVLTDNELNAGRLWVEQAKKKDGKKILLMQPFGQAGGYPKRCESVCNEAEPVFDESYRSLVMDNINGLVNKLKDEYTIFVVKDQNQINIKDTIGLTENPRLLFSILPFVDGIVCCDSMLQHAAAAVGVKCPVVVFWGGTEPIQFGYEKFLNLEKDVKRVNEPNRLPHDHSYYLRKNKDCNVFDESFEDECVKYLKEKVK